MSNAYLRDFGSREKMQETDDTCDTLLASMGTGGGNVPILKEPMIEDLRIRKLSPNECFRLQGVKDEDYNKVAIHQSNTSLYHLAGDSICTLCLMALFGEMLDIDWQEHFDHDEWWTND